MKMRKLFNISCICALTLLGACASSGKTDKALAIEDTRTVLDVHKSQLEQVEARFMISGFQGQLTNEESTKLKDFVLDYSRKGRGNIIISYPSGAIVDGATDALIRATQRELYIDGVEFKNMSFGSYSANGQINPLVLSFAYTEAGEVECTPWSQINPQKVGSNQSSPRFGCAKAANLAAMIVDPADLNGERRDDKVTAEAPVKAIDNYRNGKIEQVSGSITGGKN